jgi:hypothetical protein
MTKYVFGIEPRCESMDLKTLDIAGVEPPVSEILF